MTDKETSLALVERMIASRWSGAGEDERRILILAKTAALIEVREMSVIRGDDKTWGISDGKSRTLNPRHWNKDLHTAVSAVADRIRKEVK